MKLTIQLADTGYDFRGKERAPDGSKDENVFDIQQGVSIGIFVKHRDKIEQTSFATVRHADLWGTREKYDKNDLSHTLVGGKYYWLAKYHIGMTEWSLLKPQSPFYLFKTSRRKR